MIALSIGVSVLEAQRVEWQEGNDLTESLQTDVSIKWSAAPLKERLLGLGTRYGVAIVLDRRVDPGKEITLAVNGVTVEQLLYRIADKLELGVCRIDNVLYLGPRKTTQRLPQLVEHSSAQIKSQRGTSASTTRKNLAWIRLANPRGIAVAQAHQNNFEWSNAEAIPHDVWAAQNLPRLTLAARLGIVLAGFDLWFEPQESGGWKILPMNDVADKTNWRKCLIKLPLPQDTPIGYADIKEKFGDLRLKKSGRSIYVGGEPERVAELRRFLVDSQLVERTPIEDQRYDLANTTASRGAILASLANQAGLKFVYDQESLPALQAKVTIDVRQLSVPELARVLLKDSGLNFEVKGNQLKVFKE